MWLGKKISVVIPCYNEEEGLRTLLPQLPSSLDEVIVVDNASTDGTAAAARAAGAHVVPEPRRGYGRAFKTGFAAATGDIIVAMDGDGTYQPCAIEYFIDVLLADGLSFISGARISTDGLADFPTAARYLGGKLFNVAAFTTDFLSFHDVLSGMWVFERDALRGLHVAADGFYFSQEIKLEAFRRRRHGLRAAEIPLYFHFHARRGASKVRIFRHGVGGILYFWRRRIAKITGRWTPPALLPPEDVSPAAVPDAVPKNEVKK